MKSSSLKKLLATLLAANMMIGLAACGNGDQNETVTSSEVEKTETKTESSVESSVAEEEEGITFPLEEQVTFDIMVKTTEDLEKGLENNKFWKDLEEMTNVKINFIVLPADNAVGTLNAMFTANEEGDAILGGGILNETDLSLMAANGLLMALDEYVDDPEIMPNLNERVLSESPATRGTMTTADGHVYSLVRYDALEGQYLESPIWINKTWVEKLGKSVDDIKTLEDLEEVLLAFAQNDMDGDGDATNEIPYIAKSGDAYRHMEVLLGLWGMPTKDNTNDNYVYLEDGEVIFIPTTETYKEAIKTFNRWYENGIIWSEVFTATNETLGSIMNTEVPTVGMYTFQTVSEYWEDDFVRLAPVSVEGYETRWYVNPGINGNKGVFSMTRSCENPEILMKWIDTFYALENTMRAQYNDPGDGYCELVDGVYSINTLNNEQNTLLYETNPTFLRLLSNSNLPVAFTREDYSGSVALSELNQQKQENVEFYREYLNDEIWPRPYINNDDITRLAELRTDIFNTVSTKRAEWITGVSDIDAEWDDFVKEMENVGIEEFVEILQRNYDVFNASMK